MRQSLQSLKCLPRRRRLVGQALGILIFSCALGCGSGTPYKLAPVSGIVTLDGKPLPGAAVTFQPQAGDRGDPGPGSAARTDSDGKFVLQTAETKKHGGAVVGKHVVRISGLQTERAADDDSQQGGVKDPVPPRYRNEGLPFEVPAAGTDKANFDLNSKPQQPGPAVQGSRNIAS